MSLKESSIKGCLGSKCKLLLTSMNEHVVFEAMEETCVPQADLSLPSSAFQACCDSSVGLPYQYRDECSSPLPGGVKPLRGKPKDSAIE